MSCGRTSENYTNKSGDKVTSTEWHNIVCWRGLATIAENYIHKGSQVYIEGKLRTRTYDAPDGTKRYATEILADSLQLLGKRPDGQTTEEPKTMELLSDSEPSSLNAATEEPLPF